MHHFKGEKAIESSEAKLLIHIRNFTKIFKASLHNKTMKGLYFPYHNFELTFPPNPSPPPPPALSRLRAVIFPTPTSTTDVKFPSTHFLFGTSLYQTKSNINALSANDFFIFLFCFIVFFFNSAQSISTK